MKIGKITISGIALCLLASTATQASLFIEDLTSLQTSKPADPTTMSLYCPAGNGEHYGSKVALMETDSRDFDYGLTTAHGIKQSLFENGESCFVLGLKGQPIFVEGAVLSPDYKAGSSSDWAVIKVRKIEKADYIRFSLAIIDAHLLSDNDHLEVTFPKARGLGYSHQSCRVYSGMRLGMSNTNILTHDCRAIPGQSGSPVSVAQADKNYLLGIHLGRAFIYRSPVTEKPENMGYLRRIDLEMGLAIETAVESLSE